MVIDRPSQFNIVGKYIDKSDYNKTPKKIIARGRKKNKPKTTRLIHLNPNPNAYEK